MIDKKVLKFLLSSFIHYAFNEAAIAPRPFLKLWSHLAKKCFKV